MQLSSGVQNLPATNSTQYLEEYTQNLEELNKLLAEALVKNEAILESIGEGLIVVDQKARITLMNQRAQEMLGWKLEEVIDRPVFEIAPLINGKGKLLTQNKRPILIALQKGEMVDTTATDTYYILRRDKTTFPVDLVATPLILDGKTVGAINLLKDITREKEIDRAKNEFIAIASHQLRTPLSTINWYVEHLLDSQIPATKHQRYLKGIYETNKKMVRLVNSLLEISRIELGMFALHPQMVDPAKVAQNAIHEIKQKLTDKKLKLIHKFDKIGTIFLDANVLGIILQNLLSNAISYTKKGGRINLKIAKKQNSVRIQICDNGYGIPKTAGDKIFEKNFRANNVKRLEGTGLGLYIVKAIVDRLGGNIDYHSQLHKGTCFYVTIPIAQHETN